MSIYRTKLSHFSESLPYQIIIMCEWWHCPRCDESNKTPVTNLCPEQSKKRVSERHKHPKRCRHAEYLEESPHGLPSRSTYCRSHKLAICQTDEYKAKGMKRSLASWHRRKEARLKPPQVSLELAHNEASLQGSGAPIDFHEQDLDHSQVQPRYRRQRLEIDSAPASYQSAVCESHGYDEQGPHPYARAPISEDPYGPSFSRSHRQSTILSTTSSFQESPLHTQRPISESPYTPSVSSTYTYGTGSSLSSPTRGGQQLPSFSTVYDSTISSYSPSLSNVRQPSDQRAPYSSGFSITDPAAYRSTQTHAASPYFNELPSPYQKANYVSNPPPYHEDQYTGDSPPYTTESYSYGQQGAGAMYATAPLAIDSLSASFSNAAISATAGFTHSYALARREDDSSSRRGPGPRH